MTPLKIREIAQRTEEYISTHHGLYASEQAWQEKFAELILEEYNTCIKLPSVPVDETDIVYRLRKRAEIRRQIPGRKSVQEGKPDRLADLLDEAATVIDNYQEDVK